MVLKATVYAEVVEPGGKEEGVGVLAEGCEHLRAGCDNFRDHVLSRMRATRV